MQVVYTRGVPAPGRTALHYPLSQCAVRTRDKRAAAKSSKAELASAKSSKTATDKASDSDDVAPVPKATKPSGKSGTASKAATATKAGGRTAASEEPARTRPTNNQLL